MSPRPRSAPVVTPCSPVEDLEQRDQDDEGQPHLDHAAVGGEDAQDRTRKGQEHPGGGRHEARPERDGGPPGRRRARGIPPTHRVPDPHGAGRRDAERHHVGQPGQVDDDLVRRQGGRVESAGEHRDRGERAVFQRRLRRRGPPQLQDPPQTGDSDPGGQGPRPDSLASDRAPPARAPYRRGRCTSPNPAPSTPRAGAPRLPNTSTQLAAALTTLAVTKGEHDRLDHRQPACRYPPERGVQQQQGQAPGHDGEIGGAPAAGRPDRSPRGRGGCPPSGPAGPGVRSGPGPERPRAATSGRTAPGRGPPNACDTSVSRPSSRPMPKTLSARNSALPTPTAPIASGPRRPTMAMSTICIATQPTSAITTGAARATRRPQLVALAAERIEQGHARDQPGHRETPRPRRPAFGQGPAARWNGSKSCGIPGRDAAPRRTPRQRQGHEALQSTGCGSGRCR